MAMNRLGNGGFGEVWLLVDIDPPMVMKKAFHTNDYGSYLRELRTLKELCHENVVRYYDAPMDYPGIDKNEWLMFMEYCEHGSLTDVLRNKDIVYTMATIAKWSTEMFSALEYIKGKQLVHHDVKPDNLFIQGYDYTLKLGDFGIVREVDKAAHGSSGGTGGYMAPEVRRAQELSGEDVFKCDIYGAGWVVLDMVNRSKPGSKDIAGILPDGMSHLTGLRLLVLGCTKDQVEERFDVQQALLHSMKMIEAFASFDRLPDVNPHSSKIEPPYGLYGMGLEALLPAELLTAPGVSSWFLDSTRDTGKTSKPEKSVETLGPRERLLIELKEQLGATTALKNASVGLSELHCNYDPADPNFILLRDDFRVERAVLEDFNELRRLMCDQILQKIGEMPVEDQYDCAEQLNNYWKVEAPKLLGTYQQYLQAINTEPQTNKSSSETRKAIAGILDLFQTLVVWDAEQQIIAQDFGVRMLVETNRGTLPHWDILRLLDQTITNIVEVGKFFTKRISYPIATLEGSTSLWYVLEHLGIFLRKDCTEIRLVETGSKKLSYHDTLEKEPLNYEQIRRSLVEARTAYERKLQKWRCSVENGRPHQARHFASLVLNDEMLANCWAYNMEDVCRKLASVPGQPFRGYVFVYDMPPAHKCLAAHCEDVGGYPSWAAPKFQIRHHKCSTQDQKDYIEAYTLISIALQYIARWRTCEYWLNNLLVELIAEIEAKERQWALLFEWVELNDGSNALLFKLHLTMKRGTFVNNNLELVYLAERANFLRFVPVRLADLKPMLDAMADYYQDYDRVSGGVDPEVMQPLIAEFWKTITTPKAKNGGA